MRLQELGLLVVHVVGCHRGRDPAATTAGQAVFSAPARAEVGDVLLAEEALLAVDGVDPAADPKVLSIPASC